MKKSLAYSLLFCAAILSAGVFTSCEENFGDPAPAFAPDAISFSLTVNAAATDTTGEFVSTSNKNVLIAADTNGMNELQINKADFFFVRNPGKIKVNGRDVDSSVTELISISARRAKRYRTKLKFTRAFALDSSRITKASFDAADNAYVRRFTGNLSSLPINQGKVYSFLTADGKSGLIYVSEINLGTGGNAGKDGFVKLDFKVQP